MRVVVAIDSFKGCLTSIEANQAAAEGVKKAWPDAEIVQVPVSDGGEGFLDAFHAAIGGELVEVTVRDPLMRPIMAKYLLKDETAVIEIAQVSGLTLLSKEERNPMVATSYGTGQLVAAAVSKGAKNIIVGLGGSATSDAGIGMLNALIECFSKNGQWNGIEKLKNVRFTIATDVKNPLCGKDGAAHVFASQKGANPDMVLQLDERARKFANDSAKHFGYDRSKQEGAGAAGGLGYAFMQYLDANCKPGIQLLLETIQFDEIVKDADLIITGEGSADRQTLMGKLPMGILLHSGDVPVCLIAGRISERDELMRAGFSQVECINPEGMPLEEAMRKDVAMLNICDSVCRLKRLIIFDFDGTLGDTRRTIVTTMQMTIAELQLPKRTEEECAATIGLPLAGCFEKLFPMLSADDIQHCAESYRRIFNENVQAIKPQVFPGVVETLAELRKRGFTLTIASSRSHKSLEELTHNLHIADYISCLVGADDVTKAKPNPEPVLKILSRAGFAACQALVVGDMSVDILMGVNAGAKTCGVTYGNGLRKELEQAGADYIIDSIDELTRIFTNNVMNNYK